MIKKEREKKEAIRLRRKGETYAEILAKIPVAKSTLSLWLHEVGIAKHQHQQFSEKKRAALLRGGLARKKQREDTYQKIISRAKMDIASISERELFLIGTALYWAEGSKEKDGRPGSGFQFGNMDSRMIFLILVWLEKICKIPKNMLVFELYLHQSNQNRLYEIKTYWSKALGIPIRLLSRVYFKNGFLNEKKVQSGTYYGLFRIRVQKSSELVRKIAGWTESIAEQVK